MIKKIVSCIYDTVAFTLGAGAVFFPAVIFKDTHSFVVRKYHLSSPKIGKDVKLCVLADLHGVEFGKYNQRLIGSIRSLDPDVILMPGDLIKAKENNPNLHSSLVTAGDLIRNLSKKYPVYISMGNHEQRLDWESEDYDIAYEDMVKYYESCGAVVLDNGNTSVTPFGIRLYGLSIKSYHYRKSIEPHLDTEEMEDFLGGTASKNEYNILMAHDPEYFESYAGWNADLVFSGHLHGGVMRLPKIGGVISPRMKFFPKYTGGLYTSGTSKMIVSRGLGCHTIPVRVFNPGEVVMVYIKKTGV